MGSVGRGNGNGNGNGMEHGAWSIGEQVGKKGNEIRFKSCFQSTHPQNFFLMFFLFGGVCDVDV